MVVFVIEDLDLLRQDVGDTTDMPETTDTARNSPVARFVLEGTHAVDQAT